MKLALSLLSHSHAAIPVLIVLAIFSSSAVSAEMNEEYLNVGRHLDQSSKDVTPKQGCTWSNEQKSCGMSLSSISSFYNELSEEVIDLAYSLQDCSPVGNEDDCRGEIRKGCHWSDDEKCESLLFSGLQFTMDCYGAAQSIFLEKCGAEENRKSKAKCQNIDSSAGCVWSDANSLDPCTFSTTNFMKDLSTIAKRPDKKLPSVTFSEKSKKEAAALEKKCFPLGEASCKKEMECRHGDGDGCIPKIPSIMMLADAARYPKDELVCSLVDLVRLGKCALPLSEEECQELSPDCFWDGVIGTCLPGPIRVFQEAAKKNKQLLSKLNNASRTCKKITSRGECK